MISFYYLHSNNFQRYPIPKLTITEIKGQGDLHFCSSFFGHLTLLFEVIDTKLGLDFLSFSQSYFLHMRYARQGMYCLWLRIW